MVSNAVAVKEDVPIQSPVSFALKSTVVFIVWPNTGKNSIGKRNIDINNPNKIFSLILPPPKILYRISY